MEKQKLKSLVARYKNVTEIANNSSLFNSLTGMTKENPLPTTYNNDEEMANAFVDYFMDKLKAYRTP